MKHMRRFFVLLLALLLAILPVCAENVRTTEVYDISQDTGSLTVRFVDIGISDGGAGDFIILTSPEGLVMTIDSGHPWSKEYVLGALESMGITRIDYMVISHYHHDHVANTPYLMRNFEVGAVYTSYLDDPYESYYTSYMDAIAEMKLNHIKLAEGDAFYFGDKVLVEVFGPTKDFTYLDTSREGPYDTVFVNNNSLILKFTYGESTFLTAGDLYSGQENKVVAAYGELLDVDLLKISHHGWPTSSSPKWRTATSPEIAVIPASGIIDRSIMRKLLKKGEAYVTGCSGTVCVRLYEDGTNDVITEKDYSYDWLLQE